MADNELFGNSEQLDCSDCVDHGGDWECDHVHCRKGSDTISRQAAIDALGEEPLVWYDGEDEIAERNQWRRDVAAIKALPSAQPEITYQTCSDALLKMWMDNVLTDGEYNRIMDRLNAWKGVQT